MAPVSLLQRREVPRPHRVRGSAQLSLQGQSPDSPSQATRLQHKDSPAAVGSPCKFLPYRTH